MTRTHLRLRPLLPMLAAACFIGMSPLGANAGQGFFIAEPQLNVTVRIAHGVVFVGGVGYRVIGAANGFEDQLQGITGSVAIRFGGGK